MPRALIFPGEEGFGMVPVEADVPSSSSVEAERPKPGVSSPSRTDRGHFGGGRKSGGIEINPERTAAHASQFGRDQFFRKMRAHIDGLLAERASAH
jgi:hypothetical protein